MKQKLLVKTHYSIGQSILSVDDVINHCLLHKFSHVPVCDSNFFCHPELYEKCISHSLIPAFGITSNFSGTPWTIFAKTLEGYKKLVLISNGIFEPSNLDGLVIVQMFENDESNIEWKDLIELKKSTGEWFVHGVDVELEEACFFQKSDFENLCLMKAILNQSTLENELISHSHLENFCLDSSAKDDGVKVLNEIELFNPMKLGDFPLPISTSCSVEDTIRVIAQSALKAYPLDSNKRTLYAERLMSEIEIVLSCGMGRYFMILYAMVEFCREKEIMTGPARGSSASSLLAFLLGITSVDPMKYHLLFERFLSKEKGVIPDIDIDIECERRGEVIDFLVEKFGKDCCARISTISHLKEKNAVKEISKAMGLPSKRVDNLSHFCESLTATDWKNILLLDYGNQDMRKIVNMNRDIFQKTVALVGAPTSVSLHASGLVISGERLSTLPMWEMTDVEVQQLCITKEHVSKFGIVKFDILSLTYLSFLKRVISESKITDREMIDLSTQELVDQKVFSLLRAGWVAGIFHLDAQSTNCKLLATVEDFSHLVNALAMIRPGAQGGIDEYVNRYVHNKKKKILSDQQTPTYGLIIFQEQVMEVISSVLGVTLGQAELYRTWLSSGTAEVFNDFKKLFFEKSKKARLETEELWSSIVASSKYSLNKAHSVSYAMIVYQAAWLKTRYPHQFYMTLFKFQGFLPHYLDEFEERFGVLKYPDLVHSSLDVFMFKGRNSFAPLSFITGVERKDLILVNQYRLEILKLSAVEAVKFLFNGGVSLNSMVNLCLSGLLDKLLTAGQSCNWLIFNLQEIKDFMDVKKKCGLEVFGLKLKTGNYPPLIPKKAIVGFEEAEDLKIKPSEIGNEFISLKQATSADGLHAGVLSFGYPIRLTLVDMKSGGKMSWARFRLGRVKALDLAYFGKDFERIQEAVKEKKAICMLVKIGKKGLFLDRLI